MKKQIKVICPNCEEDMTYYVNKGRKQALEEVKKIIKNFKPTKSNMMYDEVLAVLKSKIKEMKK